MNPPVLQVISESCGVWWDLQLLKQETGKRHRIMQKEERFEAEGSADIGCQLFIQVYI